MDTFENNDGLRQEIEELKSPESAPETPPAEPAAVPASETDIREDSAEPKETPFWGNPYWTSPGNIPNGQPQAAQRPTGYYQQPGYYPQPPYQQPHYYPQPGYHQPQYSQPRYYPPQPPKEKPPVPPTASGTPKKKEKKKGGVWKSIIAAILILALVGGSCYATAAIVNRQWQEQSQQMSDTFSRQIQQLQAEIDAKSNAATGTSVSGSPAASGDGMTPAQVYAQNVQSVVAISSTYTSSYYGQTTTGTSTGSGFILTEDGYVVTNYHVVEGGTSLTVTTNDGIEYSAALVGGDSVNDVAVLKVDAEGLPAVTIGSSDALIVGDQVVAIGNPLGELTNTLTVGYISAKERSVTTDGFAINMIQTDAAINSGNSGGPLFNMYGQVIGITTAKYSGESSSGATIEGIGFAIPIDDVFDLIDDLMNYGYVTGAYLGVEVSDMNESAAAYYGLPLGAYVQTVTSGYAAEKAGLQAKDIIVAIGDYEITGVTSLTRALRHFQAGDTTTITVYRSGVEMVLSITLDEKPADQSAVENTESGERP